MKILVGGSRTVKNYEFVYSVLDEFYQGHIGPLTLIVGGAAGVDKAAESWAIKRCVPFLSFEAKWESGGQTSGYDRNTDMVEECDGAILIWDGRSGGTKDTKLKCDFARKPVVVVVVPPEQLRCKEKPKVIANESTNNVLDFLKRKTR